MDKSLDKFKREIVKMTLHLNILHAVNGIPSDITTIAALKLLARTMELSNERMANRNIRDITFGEMEDATKEIMEIGMKELDFILADER